MTLLQEIRNDFTGLSEGMTIELTCLEDKYKAIVTKTKKEGLMVGFPVDPDFEDISEPFTSCKYFTEMFTYKDETKKYLFLSCKIPNYQHEFASLCCEFLEPGPRGQYREEILKNPAAWWKKWTEILGNSITERNVYCVIAEMMVLDSLFQKDKTVTWLAAKAGVRDIESDTETAEVKSTIKRTGYEVTISSPYQLDSSKPFWLYFCRMEEAKTDGYSIKDMYNLLLKHGYNEIQLNNELQSQRLNLASHECNIKYKALEKLRFLVDENFPQITDSSFIGGHRPQGVDKIKYSVHLDSIKGEIWN